MRLIPQRALSVQFAKIKKVTDRSACVVRALTTVPKRLLVPQLLVSDLLHVHLQPACEVRRWTTTASIEYQRATGHSPKA